MHLLIKDQEHFERNFPEANAFLVAARLRYELFGLCRLKPENRTPWENNRIKELMMAPACKEPWFIYMIERDKVK